MYFECRHIMPNGARCHSPALRGMHYCYYHTRLHILTRTPKLPDPEPVKFPVPEDSSSIQLALAQVFNQLAAEPIDPHRAGLILYGLQIASQHVQHPTIVFPDQVVQSVTLSPEGEELAPQKHVCVDAEDCNDCPDLHTCERVVWEEEDEDDEEDAEENKDTDDVANQEAAENKNGNESGAENEPAA